MEYIKQFIMILLPIIIIKHVIEEALRMLNGRPKAKLYERELVNILEEMVSWRKYLFNMNISGEYYLKLNNKYILFYHQPEDMFDQSFIKLRLIDSKDFIYKNIGNGFNEILSKEDIKLITNEINPIYEDLKQKYTKIRESIKDEIRK